MRRAGNLWPEIVAFDHLMESARRASLGKRHVRGVAAFLERLEPEALNLQRELEDGTYRPRPAFTFRILDPKERTITAAQFRDRVVHHALIDRLEPLFGRRMIDTSFACRRGKGTHAALRCARRFARRFPYFLKLDVRKCFPSIQHAVALGTVARIVKDRRVLALFETIVGAGGSEGIGLPIGNLTSQWIANLVLDRLDHFVKETLRARAYLRYMDDFVLFDAEKERLWRWHGEIRDFLADTLRLSLKEESTRVAPVTEGLPFLGFAVFPGTARLLPGTKSRARARIRARLREHRLGYRSEPSLIASLGSLLGHLAQGRTRALTRSWFAGAPESPPDARVRDPTARAM